MPTLDWIGKKAVVNHHREVPFHILKEDESLSFGKKDSGNLIVEGDNLVALKALLPYYAGKVKCIYIDPPYNTGNEKWVYNDNVNSPEIKKWLGQVVGKESEDLSRHDKWLCMMYPRLQLLREFLTEDGVIFISIDDNEQANLKLLCDEIFGLNNFLGDIIWEKADSPRMDAKIFSSKHDHTIVFAKCISFLQLNKIIVKEVPEHYNKVDDNGRRYYLKPLRTMGKADAREDRPNLYFGIKAPDDTMVYPIRSDGTDGRWRWSKNKVELEKERLEWVKGRKGWSLYSKIYAEEGMQKPIETIWYNKDVGSNRTAIATLKSVFGDEKNFETAKPVELLVRICSIATDKDSLILDSFAGSGTTAQAVLELNKEDGGNRKFILTEMLPEVAEPITRERAKRVIERDGLQEQTGFKFAKLGEPMHTADGDINPNIKYSDLARHVFFMATGTPLAYDTTEFKTPLVGVSNGVAIYLLYNGILGDESVNGGNRLTQKVLKSLPKHDGVKIIYGTACGLSEMMLRKNNIVFRQIPYSIFDK